MKKRLLGLLVLALVLLSPTTSLAKQDIKLEVNGKIIKTDVTPFAHNGRTYVPVRFIAENLNMKVDWREGTWEGTIDVILTNPNTGRQIEINAVTITSSDGISYTSGAPLEDPPYILKHNRTFLPIRYIANALHMDVTWNQDTQTVGLATNNNPDVYPIYVNVYNPDDPENPRVEKAYFSVEYRDGEYKVEGQNFTVADFVESAINKLYDDTITFVELNTSLFLYGSNIFEMSPTMDKITAYTGG